MVTEGTGRLRRSVWVTASMTAGVALAAMVGFEVLAGSGVSGSMVLALVAAGVLTTVFWGLLGGLVLRGHRSGGGGSVGVAERLALVALLSWMAVGLCVGLFFWRFVEPYRVDRAWIIFLCGSLSGLAGALGMMVRVPSVGGRRLRVTSIRRRMALVLGGLVFFACGFALLVAFAIQREMVMREVGGKARILAAGVETSARGGCDGARLNIEDGVAVYLRGDDGACWLGRDLSAELLWVDRIPDEGVISVPGSGLVGASVRVAGGSLTLFQGSPDWVRRTVLISSIFYTLLFIYSAYLAGGVSRQLTEPVISLRDQVNVMEGGNLDSPIELSTGDEVGELGAAMERMRVSLRDKVATIRALNEDLELRVEERTAELKSANEDLSHALEALRDAQEQLVQSEKMASLGRLLAGLAHELRNPVNAVVNNAGPVKEGLGVIGSGGYDERRVERLRKGAEVIERAGKRTVELLDSLSRMVRGAGGSWQMVDLAKVVEAGVVLLGHRLEGRVSLSQDVGNGVFVMGNEGELTQVVVNLLDNAIDAALAGGSEPQVGVSLRREDSQVVLSVWDSGNGMSEEAGARVFEPFFTTKDTGTGLGLAITHGICDRHGGQIRHFRRQGFTVFEVRMSAAQEAGSIDRT